MNPKILLKTYSSDPGQAILDVIRSSDGEITKAQVVAVLVEAGARKLDANNKWDAAQKSLKAHPHIRSKKGSSRYAWSSDPVASSVALERLQERLLKSTPAWLSNALLSVVKDSLARNETAGARAQMTWSDLQMAQQAQLIAEFAGAVGDARNGAGDEGLSEWLTRKTEWARLEPFGEIGEVDRFDADLHDSAGTNIEDGEEVVVTRQGFRWYGPDDPQVLVRAIVRPK